MCAAFAAGSKACADRKGFTLETAGAGSTVFAYAEAEETHFSTNDVLTGRLLYASEVDLLLLVSLEF